MALLDLIFYAPELKKELRACHERFKRLVKENRGEHELAQRYGEFMFGLMLHSSDVEEKRRCLEELRQLSEENEHNITIVQSYSDGLLNMLNSTGNLREKRESLKKLMSLAEGMKIDRLEILFAYISGLFNMRVYDEERRADYLAELQKMLSNVELAKYVAEGHPQIIIETKWGTS